MPSSPRRCTVFEHLEASWSTRLRRAMDGRLNCGRVTSATNAAPTEHSIEVALRNYRQVSEEDRRAAAEAVSAPLHRFRLHLVSG